MELAGEQLIHAPKQQVWDALNDPDMLLKCIPGCEELTNTNENEMQARLMAKVGPVRARFTGKVNITDQTPPDNYTLHFEGSGGAAGIASGQSVVTLHEEGTSTRLHYTVQASVGGKLGQVGGRLIDASAKKMAAEFFRSFNENITSPDTDSIPEPEATTPELEPSGTNPPVEQDERPIAHTPPAVVTAAPSSWSGEVQRVFWLGLGMAIGATLVHFWHV